MLSPTAPTPYDVTSPCETYERATTSSSLFLPKGCYRLLGPGTGEDAPDYLAGYSIELQPQGAGVTWGRVDWEEDPFKDLKCDAMTVMVADEVDICAMFDEEVDYAVGDSDDWSPEVVFEREQPTVVMWRATGQEGRSSTDAGAAEPGKFFKTVWFDDNLNGRIKKDAKMPNRRTVRWPSVPAIPLPPAGCTTSTTTTVTLATSV